MRDIKFKVLNKLANRIGPLSNLDVKSIIDHIKFKQGRMHLEETEWAKFLQYTGLKDKNGVEIYEDDNLRINLDGTEYISPVMKRHGCWVIYHPYRLDMHTGERDYINFGWWTSHDNVEVVGNIHEQDPQT